MSDQENGNDADCIVDDEPCADDGPKTKGPERRCILTRQSHPKDALVRLVIGPTGDIVVDVAAKLPGRGAWISPDRDLLETSLPSAGSVAGRGKKNSLVGALSRAFKTQIAADKLPDDLIDVIERLLEKRVLDRIGLENRAGHVRTGYDVIRMLLKEQSISKRDVILVAQDAAADSVRKMSQLVRPNPIQQPFGRDTLSTVLGKDNVVHALILGSTGGGAGAEKLMVDLHRLQRIRSATASGDASA